MFHRDLIARFVAALNFTPEEGAKIKKRAEEAVAEFSSPEEGHFSGGSLEEVLGSKKLADTFSDMWEKQHVVLNP